MAKKKLTAAELQAQENLKAIEAYIKTVDLIYDGFIEELARMAGPLANGISKVKVFSFDDFPGLKSKLNKLVNDTTLKAVNAIDAGKEAAILRSNIKNDSLVDKFFNIASKNLSPEKAQQFKAKLKSGKYYDRNLTAAATRETKSELSKRVYKITRQFTRLSEVGIDIGIAQGKPARMLASEIRKAVKDPKFAYRRVRNSKGNLEWSKAAKKYAAENPPGVGVYLNPQKNFERLTRTEINMAYRTADHLRNEAMDFVVGIRINLSTNPNHCPFCIRMAGDYPKSFIFRGWHPQCRCYRTTILKTAEELQADSIRIIQGKEPLNTSINQVKKPNPELISWVKENKKNIAGMRERGTVPYWMQDNFNNKNKVVPGQIKGGVKSE